MKSAIVDRMDRCLICGSYNNIQVHHVFFGNGKRKLSDKYKMVVPLCIYHHTGSNLAVHGKDGHKLDLELKQLGQKAFEWTHTRDEFRATFGKSYL